MGDILVFGGTAFPGALDAFPHVTDFVHDVTADHMNSVTDAIEALQAKIGIDGSLVVTSVDYQLRQGRFQSEQPGGSAGSIAFAFDTANAHSGTDQLAVFRSAGTDRFIVGGGGATDTYLQLAAGQTAAVSPGNTGRIRFNAATQHLEFSENGGGWTQLVGSTLQQAYASGETVTTTAGDNGPVVITNGSTTLSDGVLRLIDANANAGRTGVLVAIEDANAVGGGTPDTLQVSRTAAGGRAIRAQVLAAGDVAWSSGLTTPSTTAVIHGDGDAVFGGSGMSAGERLRVVGDARVEGKLTVTGLIDPTGLVFDEQATVPGGAPGAAKGTIWVRNDSPNVLMFTDDAGSDFVLSPNIAPADAPYLTNGAVSGLSAETDVTGNNPVTVGGTWTFGNVTSAVVASGPVQAVYLTLPEQGAAPSAGANVGQLYTLDIGGVTELHYRDSNGNSTQLTALGVEPAPSNAAYLTNGAVTGLSNEVDVNSVTGLFWGGTQTFDNATVAAIIGRAFPQVAGVDGPPLRFTGTVVGNAPRNIDVRNEADAGADAYRLRFNNNGGTQLATLDQAGKLTVTDSVLVGNGTVALPGFAFSSDPDTGFWRPEADRLILSCGGAILADFNNNSAGTAVFIGAVRSGNGTQALPGLAFGLDPGTGLWLIASGRVALIVADGATGTPIFDADYNSGSPSFGMNNNGTETVAAINRDTDRDTGIYWPTTNALGITAGGVQTARFEPDLVTFRSTEAAGAGLVVDFVSDSPSPDDEDNLVTLRFIGQGPATYASVIVSINSEAGETGIMDIFCDTVNIVATSAVLNGDSSVVASGSFPGATVTNSGGAALVGLYAQTPVARAAHIADPSGGGTIDSQARTAINAILVAIENIGITELA